MKIFQNSIGQDVKIFGDIIEDEVLAQIQQLANFKPYQNSHIRVMPDVHAGKGCTIWELQCSLMKQLRPILLGLI